MVLIVLVLWRHWAIALSGKTYDLEKRISQPLYHNIHFTLCQLRVSSLGDAVNCSKQQSG